MKQLKGTWRTIITVGVVILLTFIIYKAVFTPKADGVNIKVYSESDSTVYFYPICPKCEHVSEMYEVNISKGENHKTSHMCEKCFNVYNVEIKR